MEGFKSWLPEPKLDFDVKGVDKVIRSKRSIPFTREEFLLMKNREEKTKLTDVSRFNMGKPAKELPLKISDEEFKRERFRLSSIKQQIPEEEKLRFDVARHFFRNKNELEPIIINRILVNENKRVVSYSFMTEKLLRIIKKVNVMSRVVDMTGSNMRSNFGDIISKLDEIKKSNKSGLSTEKIEKRLESSERGKQQFIKALGDKMISLSEENKGRFDDIKMKLGKMEVRTFETKREAKSNLTDSMKKVIGRLRSDSSENLKVIVGKIVGSEKINKDNFNLMDENSNKMLKIISTIEENVAEIKKDKGSNDRKAGLLKLAENKQLTEDNKLLISELSKKIDKIPDNLKKMVKLDEARNKSIFKALNIIRAGSTKVEGKVDQLIEFNKDRLKIDKTIDDIWNKISKSDDASSDKKIEKILLDFSKKGDLKNAVKKLEESGDARSDKIITALNKVLLEIRKDRNKDIKKKISVLSKAISSGAIKNADILKRLDAAGVNNAKMKKVLNSLLKASKNGNVEKIIEENKKSSDIRNDEIIAALNKVLLEVGKDKNADIKNKIDILSKAISSGAIKNADILKRLDAAGVNNAKMKKVLNSFIGSFKRGNVEEIIERNRKSGAIKNDEIIAALDKILLEVGKDKNTDIKNKIDILGKAISSGAIKNADILKRLDAAGVNNVEMKKVLNLLLEASKNGDLKEAVKKLEESGDARSDKIIAALNKVLLDINKDRNKDIRKELGELGASISDMSGERKKIMKALSDANIGTSRMGIILDTLLETSKELKVEIGKDKNADIKNKIDILGKAISSGAIKNADILKRLDAAGVNNAKMKKVLNSFIGSFKRGNVEEIIERNRKSGEIKNDEIIAALDKILLADKKLMVGLKIDVKKDLDKISEDIRKGFLREESVLGVLNEKIKANSVKLGASKQEIIDEIAEQNSESREKISNTLKMIYILLAIGGASLVITPIIAALLSTIGSKVIK